MSSAMFEGLERESERPIDEGALSAAVAAAAKERRRGRLRLVVIVAGSVGAAVLAGFLVVTGVIPGAYVAPHTVWTQPANGFGVSEKFPLWSTVSIEWKVIVGGPVTYRVHSSSVAQIAEQAGVGGHFRFQGSGEQYYFSAVEGPSAGFTTSIVESWANYTVF